MIKGIIDASQIIEPKLKIAIVGASGIGKSWLATSIASETNKVLDLDFDDRAASLQGKPFTFVKTYRDKDINNPTAVSDLESDINDWEYQFVKRELPYGTFIVDSATYMRAAIEREIMRQQPTLSRSIVKFGPRTIKVAQGYDVFSGNRIFFENLVSRLSALGNLIVTFHERDEEDKTKSTAQQKAYTGKVTIEPPHLASVLSTFNDVWWLTSNYTGKRVLITGLDDEFIGKTTLKGLDKAIVDPDIKKMLAVDKAARNGNTGSAGTQKKEGS
jgi:hypothetical protein